MTSTSTTAQIRDYLASGPRSEIDIYFDLYVDANDLAQALQDGAIAVCPAPESRRVLWFCAV
jgi:hypothetical protein